MNPTASACPLMPPRFTGSGLTAFSLLLVATLCGATPLVAAVPSVTSSATATGTVGAAFSYQITASNTPTSFGATGLPAGLSVNTSNGLISGTPTATATSSVTLKAINASGTGTKTLTLTVNPPKPVVNSATTASGQTGVAFSYQITATNSPTSFTATPLPAGVTLNAASGLISGTPTSAGTTSVSLTASNASGASPAMTLTITVALSKPVVNSATTASGQTGVAFSYQITATNSPTSFTATPLPTGVTLNVATGLISGIPTAVGTTSVSLTASNASGASAVKTLTITVALGKPVVNSATTASGQTGVAFSYQITATNSPTSFTATPLPTGVTLNAATGLISGTPTAVGTTSVSLTASNASGASAVKTLTITVTPGKPVITSATTASGSTGTAFSYQIVATNSPTSFTASPLPAGLSVSATTGLISGTPTGTGATSVSLTASNASGASAAVTLTITVTLGKPVITSATTASGTKGVAFSYQITATNNPTSFTASPLPAGVTVNASTGLISGTPTATGTTSVSLTASNASGASAAVTLTITVVLGKPVITSPTTANGTKSVAFSYQITATNSPTGFTASPLPAGVTLNATTGLISGTPTATGTTSTVLTASNASGASAAVTLTINVTIKPVITSATTASGSTGTAFNYQITAANNPTSFTASPLPVGVTVNATTGFISGTPTAAGTTSTILTASNASGASAAVTLTITVVLSKPAITSPTTASGTKNVAFSYQITATNNPTGFAASPLPLGVTVNTSTGLISGTPTATGTASVNLTASNASGAGTPVTLTITINLPPPVITSPTTAAGKIGTAFNYQITATNNPTSFGATGLPAGLSINSTTGLISGTPTLVGISTVNLTAANAGGSGPAPLTLTILASLPYTADFETAEGYVLGSLSGQLGWLLSAGTGLVTTQDFFNGSQSIQLPASTPPALLTQTFGNTPGEGIIFLDFFAKPVAESDPNLATLFSVEQAKFAFQKSGTVGTLQVFNGNGTGGGSWVPAKFSIPLGANNQAQAWLRLTARLNFGLHTWDLYANGNMVAADVGALTNTTYLSTFQVKGDTSTASGIDYIYAGPMNPVFAPNDDINNNGIDDAWELAHGLSLQTNNRNLSLAGNGTTVIQAYVNGTDPTDFYNGLTPTIITLGGNGQLTTIGQFNALPFDVAIWNSDGTAPLANAPVTFTVQSGAGKVALTNTGYSMLADSVALLTDSTGTAQVYYRQPSVAAAQSVITLTAGNAQATFTTLSLALPIPTNVTASSFNSRVNLTWQAGGESSGDVTYTVLRSIMGGNYTAVGQVVDGNNFSDSGLNPGTTYSYEVIASNYAGSSTSAPISVTTLTLSGPPLPTDGMQVWLRPDDLAVAGQFSIWTDQSGTQHNATQVNIPNQPTVAPNQLNGFSVVRFDGISSWLSLPNVMQIDAATGEQASAGEIFVVWKAALTNSDSSVRNNGMWTWGGNIFGDRYPFNNDGAIYDSFGRTDRPTAGKPNQSLDQFHIYNVSSQAGQWRNWINGQLQSQTTTNSVAWPSTAILGQGQGYYFAGDIAEVIVYSRTLNDVERESVGTYLASKYALYPAPSVPFALAAAAISDSQVELNWSVAARNDRTVYEVERRIEGGDFSQIAEVTNETSYLDSALTSGVNYTYRVRMRTYVGTGDYSSTMSVQTLLYGFSMPTDSIRLWLKADSVAGLDQSSVGVWIDDSGKNNNAIQLSGNAQPKLVANQLNGRPVVRFDGISSLLNLPNVMRINVNTGEQASAGEIFVVWKALLTNSDGSLRNNGMWTWGGNSSGDRYPFNGDNAIYDSFGRADRPTSGTPAQSLGQFHWYDASSMPGQWTNWVSGQMLSQTSLNAVTWSAAPILGFGQGYYFAGDIAEIIVYSRVLNAVERDSVGTYLNRKYGLAVADGFGNYRDSNFDGLVDSQDKLLGFDPYSMDVDGDGIPNQVEVANGTDPLNADTDHDGVPDNLDAYPLDPTRWQAPVLDPNDHTPPVVTLTSPAQATLN